MLAFVGVANGKGNCFDRRLDANKYGLKQSFPLNRNVSFVNVYIHLFPINFFPIGLDLQFIDLLEMFGSHKS